MALDPTTMVSWPGYVAAFGVLRTAQTAAASARTAAQNAAAAMQAANLALQNAQADVQTAQAQVAVAVQAIIQELRDTVAATPVP